MTHSKVLVTYFSSSGNTKKVAEAIARALSADMEEIQEAHPRPVSIRGRGFGNFLSIARSGFHGMSSRSVPIREVQLRPSDYPLVVLGSPVYAGSLSGPMRAYIDKYASQFRSVAFFVTGEDPARSKILAQMEKAAGIKPVASATFKADEIRAERVNVTEFVEKLHG
jgi:menaquinone-dependent protoporphyrinogen IX oxidase